MSSLLTARRRRSGRLQDDRLPHGVKIGFVGFTTESTPGIVFPGQPRSVRGPAGRFRRSTPRRRSSTRRSTRSSHWDTRARTTARSRIRGAAHRHRRRRRERRCRDRRPQRLPGRRRAAERRARDRESRQGHPHHADQARDRAREGRRRLQDGRLPPAVDGRHDARRGDPGKARRAQRRTRSDPRDQDRRLHEGDSARRPVRHGQRPDLRVPGRRCRDRLDASGVCGHRRQVRDHELRRPPRRPHVPDGRSLG